MEINFKSRRPTIRGTSGSRFSPKDNTPCGLLSKVASLSGVKACGFRRDARPTLPYTFGVSKKRAFDSAADHGLFSKELTFKGCEWKRKATSGNEKY
jgi:hypothetical protein